MIPKVETTFLVIDGRRTRVEYLELLARPGLCSTTRSNIAWEVNLPGGKTVTVWMHPEAITSEMREWCRETNRRERERFTFTDDSELTLTGWIDGSTFYPCYATWEECIEDNPS